MAIRGKKLFVIVALRVENAWDWTEEKASAGKRHNFPRGMNSGNNFPQNTRESKFVAFRDKSA